MKLYVLASCYTNANGNGEAMTPDVFTTLEAAQNALQEIWDKVDLEILDETMDSQCTDFTDSDCVENDGGGLAYIYYKDGSMTHYEIFEVEVDL